MFHSLILALALAASFYGPYNVDRFEIIDGDTIRATVEIWPGLVALASIRVAGVDTPELRGKCPGEKKRAREAKQYAIDFLGTGPLTLTALKKGKYAGRYVAFVARADGADLTTALLAAGHGRPYHGGARQGWCD